MRSDYILIGIITVIGVVIQLIKEAIIRKATRCCGYCVKYKECWKTNCYEAPACSGFEERYSDFNRD